MKKHSVSKERLKLYKNWHNCARWFQRSWVGLEPQYLVRTCATGRPSFLWLDSRKGNNWQLSQRTTGEKPLHNSCIFSGKQEAQYMYPGRN